MAGRLAAKIDKVAGVVETNRCVGRERCLLLWVERRGSQQFWVGQGDKAAGVVNTFRRPEGEQQGTRRPCSFGHLSPKHIPKRRTNFFSRPDEKTALYQAAIKQGDLLLNRVQKLSKVIDLE